MLIHTSFVFQSWYLRSQKFESILRWNKVEHGFKIQNSERSKFALKRSKKNVLTYVIIVSFKTCSDLLKSDKKVIFKKTMLFSYLYLLTPPLILFLQFELEIKNIYFSWYSSNYSLPNKINNKVHFLELLNIEVTHMNVKVILDYWTFRLYRKIFKPWSNLGVVINVILLCTANMLNKLSRT